jgi:hypothetical protein
MFIGCLLSAFSATAKGAAKKAAKANKVNAVGNFIGARILLGL